MKILLFGAGEVGRAIAQLYLTHKNLQQLFLVDLCAKALSRTITELAKYVDISKLFAIRNDFKLFIEESDLIIIAVPWAHHRIIIDNIISFGKPIVSVSRPDYSEMSALDSLFKKNNSLFVAGAGVEPGLTEILALHVAKYFTQLDELHIKCGGITKTIPQNKLRYKALFGHHYLPISMRPAYTVTNGKLMKVNRFSSLETHDVSGVGQLEAWHDGMVPWLYDFPSIARAHTVTQKTLRWPGFVAQIHKLNDLGLLSENLIQIKGIKLSAKQFIEHLYHSEVQLQDEDNLTLLQMKAYGVAKNVRRKIDLDIRYQHQTELGLNSMNLLTGLVAVTTGSYVLNQSSGKGFFTLEKFLNEQTTASLLQSLKTYSSQWEVEIDDHA